MVKITKKEYNREKALIQEQIAGINKKIQALDKWSNELDWDKVKVDDIKKIDKIGDYWNGLYYKQHELKKELDYLEDRWDRRNWTGSDWNSWELITSNID